VNPLVPTPIPPAILIREHALVVVLGALRMVIGADRVYLLSVPAEAPNTNAFLSSRSAVAVGGGGGVVGVAASASASALSNIPTSNAASNSEANWAFPDVNGA